MKVWKSTVKQWVLKGGIEIEKKSSFLNCSSAWNRIIWGPTVVHCIATTFSTIFWCRFEIQLYKIFASLLWSYTGFQSTSLSIKSPQPQVKTVWFPSNFILSMFFHTLVRLKLAYSGRFNFLSHIPSHFVYGKHVVFVAFE